MIDHYVPRNRTRGFFFSDNAFIVNSFTYTNISSILLAANRSPIFPPSIEIEIILASCVRYTLRGHGISWNLHFIERVRSQTSYISPRVGKFTKGEGFSRRLDLFGVVGQGTVVPFPLLPILKYRGSTEGWTNLRGGIEIASGPS